MAYYKDFIPANTALPNAIRIGVYDSNNNKICVIPLGSLAPKNNGAKQYSFGAISDVHIQYDTAQTDFQSALTYLNDTEDVAFTCVCGDLTAYGTADEMETYKIAVDSYSSNTPVYAITGNHDPNHENDISQYTGHPLYYSFTYGDDVYIMVGIVGTTERNLFAPGTLQWLYETLEANRNKRCFVFQHVRPQDGCGNALGIYAYDIWGGTEATVFEGLMTHYKNAHLFHGHSHLRFYLQSHDGTANVSKDFGGWSIHIPSISVPRDTTSVLNPSSVTMYAESEGYVVDVYENGIHLRGRDFVKGEFLPIASYWLDTTLHAVEEGTYTDSTGTITIK
jgi:hypothetical protein